MTNKFNLYDYKMCPIRFFKQMIRCVDAFQNLIFASDAKGLVGIFLICENDMENEDDTLQSLEI
jgi:hypothetical protein